MHVQFLMPHYTNEPVGGFLVAYSIANVLVEMGVRTTVILPKQLEPRTGVIGEIKNVLWPRVHRLRHNPLVTWFPLDPRVELRIVHDPREKYLDGADVTVATMWTTAQPVMDYTDRQGKKLHYVLAHETWSGRQDRIHDTFRLPMHKLVMGKWLGDIVNREAGAGSCTHVPGGVDLSTFRVEKPFDQRSRRVTLMFSTDPIKGAWDGIHAMEIVRESLPDVRFSAFGRYDPPPYLPEWLEYVQKPSRNDLRELFNESQIFLHTSWHEGWGLPPAEAMACGCAVVATRSGGPLDYLTEGRNSYLSPPKRPESLAKRLEEALLDPHLEEVAENAAQDIQAFTWEAATHTFLLVCEDLIAGRAPSKIYCGRPARQE